MAKQTKYLLATAILGVVMLAGVIGIGMIVWWSVGWTVAKPVLTPTQQHALRIAEIGDARKAERRAIEYRAKLEAEATALHGPDFLKAIPHEPGDHPAFAKDAEELKKISQREQEYAQAMVDGVRLFKEGQYTMSKTYFKKAIDVADTKAARDAYMAADKMAAEYARGEAARSSLATPLAPAPK
jgi:hypothetical protein